MRLLTHQKKFCQPLAIVALVWGSYIDRHKKVHAIWTVTSHWLDCWHTHCYYSIHEWTAYFSTAWYIGPLLGRTIIVKHILGFMVHEPKIQQKIKYQFHAHFWDLAERNWIFCQCLVSISICNTRIEICPLSQRPKAKKGKSVTHDYSMFSRLQIPKPPKHR